MTTIIIISHSEDIANGTKALLNQMAQDVNVVAHGGSIIVYSNDEHRYITFDV